MNWLLAVGRAVLGLPAPGEVYVVDPAAVAPPRAWDSWDELRVRKARLWPTPSPGDSGRVRTVAYPPGVVPGGIQGAGEGGGGPDVE